MTSLSSVKNPGSLFAELHMKRTGFKGSFLVVEGPDDSRFWRRKLAEGRCELVTAGGRVNVEGLIEKVDAQRFAGTLGIVDADFSGIDGKSPSQNLLYTDHHDLEAMLLQSSALDAVLDVYGDRERIEAFEAKTGHDVRAALLERGLAFGRLRWLSQRLSLPLNFKVVSPARFVLTTDWQLDAGGLHSEAARLCDLSSAALLAHLEALPEAPAWALCQGHDLLHILNIGLAGALGHGHVGHDTLGKALHLAFQPLHLHATSIYRDIRAWEARNPPYLVLADPTRPAP